jgi:hypothetical protein
MEKLMRTLLQASAVALAVIGGAGVAFAQNQPEKLNLSQSKEKQVTDGLGREQSQSAPGYQGQIGSKPPDSLSVKPMPDDVAGQVPETKTYLFVKLPDRILLIDPDTKVVAEIVGAPATTGTSPMSSDPPPR